MCGTHGGRGRDNKGRSARAGGRGRRLREERARRAGSHTHSRRTRTGGHTERETREGRRGGQDFFNRAVDAIYGGVQEKRACCAKTGAAAGWGGILSLADRIKGGGTLNNQGEREQSEASRQGKGRARGSKAAARTRKKGSPRQKGGGGVDRSRGEGRAHTTHAGRSVYGHNPKKDSVVSHVLSGESGEEAGGKTSGRRGRAGGQR